MPWQAALDNMQYYYLMLDRTEVYQPMQVSCRSEPVHVGQTEHVILLSVTPQNYLKQQVTPLFLHFKKLTADWSRVPEKHTDQ